MKEGNEKGKLLSIVEEILDLDPKMRFVAVVDLKGNISEAIMKSGKTSLKSQKEEEHFCRQVAIRRRMRKQFDKSLGKVSYVHVEREKVTQIVVYPKRKTVYVTMEPETDIFQKVRLVEQIKEITKNL